MESKSHSLGYIFIKCFSVSWIEITCPEARVLGIICFEKFLKGDKKATSLYLPYGFDIS